MTVRTSLALSAVLLALAPNVLAQGKNKPTAPTANKKLFCWEEKGQRVCSDALPADVVNAARDEISAVSYTHLTLPTKA